MTTAESLYEQALKLDEAERTELADRLYDSLNGDVSPEWEKAWAAEADRRWAEHQADPDSAISLEEFRKRLRASIRAK